METLLIIFLKRFSPSPNMLCKHHLLIIVYSSRFSLLLAISSVSCLLLSSLCSNTEVLGHYLIVCRNSLTFELGNNLATSDFLKNTLFIYSVQSLSRVRSLRPHELQHAMSPCPSPTPGVHSDSCPLSQWCHPAMSSSVIPFSSCLQSLPTSGSFPMSWLFASMAKVLELQLQYQSFQQIFSVDLL